MKPLAPYVLALAVAAQLGSAGEARGQGESPRQMFESARRHFDLAEYAEALEEFKAAYRLKDDPSFLYNIALCHRLLDHKLEALRFFKSYLNNQTDPARREDVEHKIATLEQEIAADERARAAAKVERPPVDSIALTPPPDKPVYKRWWLWTAVGGAVVAGVAVGVGVGLGTRQPPATMLYTFPKIQF
jgi:hypothetical protein